MMLWVLILTYLSRSARDCSCQKPRYDKTHNVRKDLICILWQKISLHFKNVSFNFYLGKKSILYINAYELRTDSMHQFMYNNAWVDATITKRDRLHSSCSSDAAATATSFHDMNISSLICSWDKSISWKEFFYDPFKMLSNWFDQNKRWCEQDTRYF